MKRMVALLAMVVCGAAAFGEEDPAGKWITKEFHFSSGRATEGRMYISVNKGAEGSIWIDHVRCSKIAFTSGSFEEGLWSEGERWGIWRLDESKASDGAKSARALYTPDKKDTMARMQQGIKLQPDTQYTVSFDVFLGEDFVGQLGCSVYVDIGGKHTGIGAAGAGRTTAASVPKRYPEAGEEPKWQTMVPNGMLDLLKSDLSGPLGWTSETDHARATWAIDGVDGDDRCLVVDVEIGGSGKWMSASFAVDADTEYAFSALFRYDNEQAASISYANVVDAKSGETLFQRTLPAFASWQRVRGLFRTKGATEVRAELIGQGGHATWFDEVMVLPSDASVHPQAPEDGVVADRARPELRWWHESGEEGTYTVLIGSDPWIMRDVRRYEVKGATAFTPPTDLPEGTWFWVALPETKERINEYVHRCVGEIRSFAIVTDRGEKADTTPPHLYRVRPALDSTADTSSPTITLKWLERGGSGIDAASVGIVLDGEAPSRKPTIGEDGLELAVGELSKGRHRVVVDVADNAGNRSEAVWQFYVGERAPSVAKLDKNGVILVNDLYFFPVFHYDYPLRDVNMERDSDYVDAGFNMIINCFNFDSALEWGIKGIQSTGGNDEGKSEEELATQFSEGLVRCHGGLDHPAYVGMWMDEAWKPGNTLAIFRAFRKIDGDHLMMPVGSGAWQIAHHPIQMIDVLSYDHYPIAMHVVTDVIEQFRILDKMRLPGQGLHYWGQALDWQVMAIAGEKLARFDYQKDFVENPKLAGHVYRPTRREMFALAALGWICGAQNAGWWGPPACKFPDVREGLKECGRRASWLAQVLRSEPPQKRATCRSSADHRVWLADKYALVEIMERESSGRRYLIAVNVGGVPAAATFSVPDLADGAPVKVLWEDREIRSSQGVFRDVIPGVGAAIYECR
ncbi:MAG: hypothetical protein V2A58_09720 [Planctomycetota bacterium]